MEWSTAGNGLLYGGVTLMALAVVLEAAEITRLIRGCFHELHEKSTEVYETIEKIRRRNVD